MRNALALSLLLCALTAAPAAAGARTPRPVASPRAPAPHSITIDVTDGRRLFSRRIGPGLLLRVSKEASVDCANFGWNVEVVRAPRRPTSRNLLYSNPGGHGADPTQVYAWNVAQKHFPEPRELPARGTPYVVTVSIAGASVTGSDEKSCFEAGTMTVSWRRTR